MCNLVELKCPQNAESIKLLRTELKQINDDIADLEERCESKEAYLELEDLRKERTFIILELHEMQDNVHKNFS